MEVSRQELATRFGEISDDKLLSHLRSGDLTSLAVQAAESTLNSRGATPSGVPGARRGRR